MKENNYNNKKQGVDLDILDKTPISKLLTFSVKELFDIQEQANSELEKISVLFNKANYRKQWIEGVIELKYKTTINDFYEKADQYISSLIKKTKENNKEFLNYFIQTEEEYIIKVEFYKDQTSSQLFNKEKLKKKFSLLTIEQFFNEEDNQGHGGKNEQ